MAWTVIVEGENGNEIGMLTEDFILSLSEIEMIHSEQYRVLKYLDPFGDTTFNHFMFTDLVADLTDLEFKLPTKQEQIKELIKLVTATNSKVHTYVKFYGE